VAARRSPECSPQRSGERSEAGRAGATDGAWLLREAMRRVLADAAASLARQGFASREILLLDIGGRGRPYAEIFSRELGGGGARVRHLVLDAGSQADVTARAERLPIAAASVDLVLCTQVLEHVQDPSAAVSEMARVLKPDGACLLTTHGTWFYHPDPEDYWRWTPAGLALLFQEGGFHRTTVQPVGGTKLALASLVLTSLERAAGEGAAGGLLRRLLVAPANLLASAWLMRGVTGRACVSGELAINYLVTARR